MSDRTTAHTPVPASARQHHVVLRPLTSKNSSTVFALIPAAVDIVAAHTLRAPYTHHLAIYEYGQPIGYTAYSVKSNTFTVPAIHVVAGHEGCDLVVVDLLIETAIAIGTIGEFVIEAHDGQHVEKYIEWCAGRFR